MLNKVDKCFLITLAMLCVSIIFPVILIFTLVGHNILFLFEIIFTCTVINYIFIVPILFVTQIITFIIKVFSKNKCTKDWLIILFNLFSLLFFGFIIICSYGAALVL